MNRIEKIVVHERGDDDVVLYRCKYVVTRKGGSYNDVLPLKTARRDSVSNLTSLGLHI